jgi:hypothetical protein
LVRRITVRFSATAIRRDLEPLDVTEPVEDSTGAENQKKNSIIVYLFLKINKYKKKNTI